MNLDDLKVVRSNERSTSQLTELNYHFYLDFYKYLEKLYYDSEEYTKAIGCLDTIREIRLSKLFRYALADEIGDPLEGLHLVSGEFEIYETLGTLIRSFLAGDTIKQ